MTKKILILDEEETEELKNLIEAHLNDADSLDKDVQEDSGMEENARILMRIKLQLDSNEKQWIAWLLSEDDITETAKVNGLSLEGKDLDEIAQTFEEKFSCLVSEGGYDWTDILEEAIKETEVTK